MPDALAAPAADQPAADHPAAEARIPPGALLDIPLDQIDADALTRDRAELDEAALWELRTSIAASGLRMPVEVFELADPLPPRRFGLLSGYRRLAAFRAQLEFTGQDRYRTIPAFLRTPQSMAECLSAMVEENEIRAELSPWERGRIACEAVRQEIFPTIEEAVARLFPAANKAKRWRIRSLAHMVEELDGLLSQPERLGLRQALRLSAACSAGFGHVIRTALEESSAEDHENQWQLVLPIILEAERQPADAALPSTRGLLKRPDRPPPASRPRAATSSSAASRPATAGACTSQASWPPATSATPSSTRSTASSPRPRTSLRQAPHPPASTPACAIPRRRAPPDATADPGRGPAGSESGWGEQAACGSYADDAAIANSAPPGHFGREAVICCGRTGCEGTWRNRTQLGGKLRLQ